jgi:hypothetical protein
MTSIEINVVNVPGFSILQMKRILVYVIIVGIIDKNKYSQNFFKRVNRYSSIIFGKPVV